MPEALIVARQGQAFAYQLSRIFRWILHCPDESAICAHLEQKNKVCSPPYWA